MTGRPHHRVLIRVRPHMVVPDLFVLVFPEELYRVEADGRPVRVPAGIVDAGGRDPLPGLASFEVRPLWVRPR